MAEYTIENEEFTLIVKDSGAELTSIKENGEISWTLAKPLRHHILLI